MTHLRIELNGITEEVSSSVISKLYEIVHAGVDASSNLQGRLHCPISYRTYVNYLTTEYPDLYISVDDYAIEFEDPNIVTYLNSIGVGSNGMITEALAAAAAIVANSANTQVTKFNELKYFTSITGSKGGWDPGVDGNIKFTGWTALEEVDISNFTSLGHKHTYGYNDTFNGCTSLKKVTASNKLVLIGHNAFKNCSNLEDITGLSGEIELACNAFGGCSKLKNSNFTNVLFLVGGHDNDGHGFYNCTALTSLLISLNSTKIPVGLFEGCNNLTSVTGLQNITVVKSYVFKNCSKLSSIDIDWTKITRIEGESFNGCQLLPIASLNCTSLLTLDTPNAFRNCKLLQSITSLGTITTIPSASFNGCTGLTSVTLPSTLTTLGDEAFYGCTSLPSITIPSSCTSIGTNTFYGCSSLLSLTSGGNVTTLGTRAFQGCSSLTTADIDWTKLTSIDHFAFLGCSTLQIPTLNCTSLTNLGISVFKGCTGLQTVASLGTLTSIPLETFSDCSNLTSINSSNITYIDNRCFCLCSKLTSVDLSSITDLGYEAFRGCTLLSSLNRTTFSGITKLHAAVFAGCSSLTGELSFPDVTELIWESGTRGAQFSGCANLTKISLGHLATLIFGYTVNSDTPFKNCTNLKIVDLGDSLTSISDWNFAGCNNLKAIKLNVTTPPSKSNGANSTELDVIFGNINVNIYVPDAAVSTYLATSPYSNFADHIKPLSTYNEASILAS